VSGGADMSAGAPIGASELVRAIPAAIRMVGAVGG
jgi:hypothetical protein